MSSTHLVCAPQNKPKSHQPYHLRDPLLIYLQGETCWYKNFMSFLKLFPAWQPCRFLCSPRLGRTSFAIKTTKRQVINTHQILKTFTPLGPNSPTIWHQLASKIGAPPGDYTPNSQKMFTLLGPNSPTIWHRLGCKMGAPPRDMGCIYKPVKKKSRGTEKISGRPCKHPPSTKIVIPSPLSSRLFPCSFYFFILFFLGIKKRISSGRRDDEVPVVFLRGVPSEAQILEAACYLRRRVCLVFSVNFS